MNEKYLHNDNTAFVALYEAICVLNEQGSDPEFPTDELALRCAPEDPKRIPSLQHIWRKDARIGAKCICGAKVLMTAESTTPKPLTLADLKRQVDAEVEHWKGRGYDLSITGQLNVWSIGDFEIRRQK